MVSAVVKTKLMTDCSLLVGFSSNLKIQITKQRDNTEVAPLNDIRSLIWPWLILGLKYCTEHVCRIQVRTENTHIKRIKCDVKLILWGHIISVSSSLWYVVIEEDWCVVCLWSRPDISLNKCVYQAAASSSEKWSQCGSALNLRFAYWLM